MVNKNRLQGAIKAAGYSQRTLAPLIGMSENTLGAKINGRAHFNTAEIAAICDVLGITSDSEKIQIFLSSSSQ